MRQTDAIIIGAGQAGLAMSHCLAELGIDHVVLERGRVAERWRSQRWDSLRLLTPNWMSRFPGKPYQGPDPDGFMTKDEFADHLAQYAAVDAAPIVTGVEVCSVRAVPGGYQVQTDLDEWRAPCVVMATGHCDVPLVPAMAQQLPLSVRQLTPSDYRNPNQLSQGGVLVVGASASGVQLAEEIQRSGRQVTISVGRHTRLPRRYRGRDIMWWLGQPQVTGHGTEATTDLTSVKWQPSIQLVGRPQSSNIDLGTLHDVGVRVVGRAMGIGRGVVHIDGDLGAMVNTAQVRLERLLARIDASADADGTPAENWPETLSFNASPATIDLAASGIRTVLWATGFKRDYRWLHVPVVDATGEIIHRRGITPSPGLFVTGLRFMRRWNPSFIDAVAADATELADDVARHLHATTRAAA